jgi:hypothetical protein
LEEHAAANLFRQGDYATVALTGSRGDWRTFAALGLIGKTEEALEGLGGGDDPEPLFYEAVAHWIGGDGERAATLLEQIAAPHAQRLLALIRKPRIDVLAQLPPIKGIYSDLLTGMASDPAFRVRSIGFRPGDLPNEPYADIHAYYDAAKPPDFYICNMVEWHLIPPNIQQLPCPLIGQSGDFDLHIQAVYPWLRLFDEMVVTDASEWRDLSTLTRLPVATFPKSFRVPDLPPIPEEPREIDFYFSGTILHPYQPEKARLLQRVASLPGIRLKLISGFNAGPVHWRLLGQAKACLSHVRHPTVMPTRAIEALAMGCAVLVQKGSVLTLFAGEDEGVLSYDNEEDLTASLRRIIAHWPDFRERARRGAAKLRRELASSRVASQYLRFLTFLAARPRAARRMRPTHELIQKRTIVEKGMLPARELASPLLRLLGVHNHSRLVAALERDPPSSRPFIDAARESVLFNYHRARRRRIPVASWLCSVRELYRQGMEHFPRSLVLRFNCVRTLLHFGSARIVSETLDLLGETLARPADYWTVDVMEDVFPWDFFPEYFNYRAYFDLVTDSLARGTAVEPALCRLMRASLHFYRGFYALYQGFHAGGLEEFRQATLLDPSFALYKLHLADRLLGRGLPADEAEAVPVLIELADGSIVFPEAAERLERWHNGSGLETGSVARGAGKHIACLTEAAARVRQALTFHERIVLAPLQPDLRQARERARQRSDCLRRERKRYRRLADILAKTRAEAEQLRLAIGAMEASNFWKIRRLWLRVKRAIGLAGGPPRQDLHRR